MNEQKFELFVKIPALINKLGISVDNILSIDIGTLEAIVLLFDGEAFESFGGTNYTPFEEPNTFQGMYEIEIEGVKFRWLKK